MALKLMSSDDAARLLGISVDQLTEMRQRQEIFGYRDGPNWKYKEQDVERLAEELKERAANPPASSDSGELLDRPLDFDLPADEDADVILLSERELGESDPNTSSTIIGRPGTQSPEESDIRLVTEEDRSASGSGVRLVPGTDPSTPGSDVKLVPDASDAEVDLDAGDAGRTVPGTSSDIILADSSLDISLDLDDDFELSDDVSAEIILDDSKSGGSAVDLSGETDRDEVLLGPSVGSDITLSPADSGISLASLSDSGLSLEEPLDLKPSDDEASLELGGDDVMSLSESSDSAEVAELQVDDDFLLTPLEDASDDASSGSQVIALDSESDFGESDLLGEAGGAGLLEEDLGADLGAAPLPAGALTGVEGAATAAPGAALTSREAPYTILNVISLGVCVLFLGLTGMMMADLLRSMWSWDTPYTINSSLMDTILGLFEG